MTWYFSKRERLIIFTLQFGKFFLDRKIPPKWIGRAVPRLPLGHLFRRILQPLDFFFCGYTKDAVPLPPIILPELARRTQAAAFTVPPVMLINVWTQLEYRYSRRATHRALSEYLETVKGTSQNFIT